MKKSTKKALTSIVIILIFGMSSIAFVMSGLGGQQQQQFKPLESNVVDKKIDTNTENVYLQNHYTFLRFYYTEKNALFEYTATLPDTMTLPSGQAQLIVNRLEGNETKAEVVNINGNYEVTDISETGLFDALCQNIMYTPTECLLKNLEQPNETENTIQNASDVTTSSSL
jgi:hypothetical protein